MAPVTSWCGGTVIFRPVNRSNAETTPLLKAVPPWKKMRLPMRRWPLEGRLRAHLDGLLLEPDASWQMCRRFLVKGSPGEAFVAAILALEGGVASRLQAVEDALESPSDKVRSGVQAAFDTRSHRSLTGRNPRRPA